MTGPDKWADLALPSTVAVSALMPQVVRVCSPDVGGLESAGWTLTKVDGDPVANDRSLENSGVLDGDVLLLHRETAPDRPAFVDDVRGSVEDHVDETAWIWRPSTTFGFGLLLASFGPLLLAVVMAAARISPLDLVVAPLGLLLALGALWWAAARPMPGVVHALQVAACGWGAFTAVLVVLGLGGPAPPAPLALAVFASAGALAAAAAGWSIDNAMLPYLAALSMVTVSAVGLVAVGLFVDGPLALRVLAVLMVLGVGTLPRMALSMGGLSALDYEVRHAGQTGTERFEENMANSDRLLLGALLGVVATIVATVLLLVLTGSGVRDLVLAALVSLVLLLRSRLFDRVSHVLPVRLGGVAGLAAVAAAVAWGTVWAAALLPVAALLVGAGVAALSAVPLADVPRASLRRLLNGVELVAIVALCVATAWSLGVYELVTTIRIGS